MSESTAYYTQKYNKHTDSITRVFESDQLSEELTWHRDRYSRSVTVTDSGHGWKFQMDNELPVDLQEGVEVFIPAGVYHRIWSGSGSLTAEISEHR